MSEQWNGKKCPSCFQGTLEQRVKPTQFEYRGRVMEYPQAAAWCGACGEGIISGNEASATESLLDVFITKVDREEASELARIVQRRNG